MYQTGNTELLLENVSYETVPRFVISQPDLREVLSWICFKDEFWGS